MDPKFAPILGVRTELTDYEQDFLVPGIRGRLETLLEYSNWIIETCKQHEDDVAFANILGSLLNPNKLPVGNWSGAQVAKKYFDDVRAMIVDQYCVPICACLKKHQDVNSPKQLANFCMDAQLIANSIVQIKDKWLLYSLTGFPYVVETNTGQVAFDEPRQLQMMLLPFKGALGNINGVAQSISDNIHEWHKENLKWKSELVSYHINRVNLRNNVVLLLFQTLTVFGAVALSAFFLLANDPFQLMKTNRGLSADLEQARQVSQKVPTLESAKHDLEQQVKDLDVQLDDARREIESLRSRVK